MSLTYYPSQIVLNITDQGKGIPKVHFDRFQSSGTAGGVGLAGMRERINEVGGELRLHTNSKGTQVTVAIPLNPDGTGS